MPPKALQAQDQSIRTIMGLPHSHIHLIVEGQTAEDALQKLEQLTMLLNAQADHPSVELGPVLTSFLPSLKQQKADLLTTQHLLEHRQFITQELVQLGFAEETLAQFFQTLASPPDTWLSPKAWLQHDLYQRRHRRVERPTPGSAIGLQGQRRGHSMERRRGRLFKVETHNSPSALEPYGGALTGIVGVNRDILGTGMGAKPIFNTDVFCFANPDQPHSKRPTMLPAESILQGVRKGVEDGGNKSGIPTVNGSLFFDPRYRAKPLVFCGTGGVLPLENRRQAGL